MTIPSASGSSPKTLNPFPLNQSANTMDNTINTKANKVEYYEYSAAATCIKLEVLNILKNEILTVSSVDRILNLLTAARVMIVSYDIERANYESWYRSQQAAEKAKAAEQLEEISEAFGA